MGNMSSYNHHLLSRQKILFFSCCLFISLALCVHLNPYFPIISDLVTTVQSYVVFDSRDACVNLVNEIVWDVKVKPNVDLSVKNESNGTKLDFYDKNWEWSKAANVALCDFQKLGKFDASELLNGSWIVIAGDSQARFVALSLLSLVLDTERVESIKGELFKRHSDYHMEVSEIGVKLDYVWAPFEKNLTNLISGYKKKKSYPDVLIMGSGLWHMLRVTNASDYGESLTQLRNSVVSVLPFSPEFGKNVPVKGSESVKSPLLFWLGMPMLINGMLNTVDKKEKMTDKMWHEYDAALCKSKLLHQFGGPLSLLDIQTLSWNCGPRCTVDGMHYDGAVYDAAVHIMLNTLLIESHHSL
ncbi:hypothetical protein ACFE04_010156 [Oxalis oulophora]